MTECWIFDLDSTLANCDSRRHYLLQEPQDWDGWYREVSEDLPNHDIIQFTKIARILGFKIFVCTGRLEKAREASERWLRKNEVQFDGLYMRPADDFREDELVKKDMLDDIIENGNVPTLVFEDRDRVVKMWRDNGIRCLQVDYGDF